MAMDIEAALMEGGLPSPASPAGPLDLEWSGVEELPLEEVRDLFLALTKSLRAAQLYDAGNPAFQRFVSNLRDAFLRVWETRDTLQVLVQEDRFLWSGEEVYRNPNRADSLSFVLYRDGIRDLTFSRGFESGDELTRFLGVLKKARSPHGVGEDLISTLWDLGLPHLAYSVHDLAAEGAFLPGSDVPHPGNTGGIGAAAESLKLELTLEGAAEGGDGAEGGGGGAPTPRVVQTEDFNPTLYALDEEDRRKLQAGLRAEMERDLRTDVLTALLDILEDSGRPERQMEVVDNLRTLLPSFLSRGALSPASRMVREVREIRAREGTLAPDAETLAERLLEDLSSPEAVGELVRAVEDGSVRPKTAELDELLRALGAGALETLLRGSGSTLGGEGRSAIREAMRGIAEANRETVVRLIGSADSRVAIGAARLAGQLRLEEAAGPLATLLDEGPLEVRLAAVEVAKDLRSPLLAGALLRLLKHPDRELRIGAARVLGGTGYPPAARELRKVLEGKELRAADVSEKVACFEAYGLLAGEEAVPYLDEVLNGKGFLGRREPAEVRAGAALGLGKVESPAARAALDRARADEDPVVRSAVGRALRGGSAG